MKGICYIFGAGHIDITALNTDNRDFVIAADAGYQHLTYLSVTADLVVGDFDSLGQKPSHPSVLEYPSEKDQTDTLIAVDQALMRGYETIFILGGVGGRLDHTFANIQTLSYIASKNARGYLLGYGTAVTVIKNGRIRFDSSKKGTVSVFCLGDTADGVTISGLKYPLDKYTLDKSNPVGVSNEFVGTPSEITVENGSLVVMWEESADAVVDNLKGMCYSAD